MSNRKSDKAHARAARLAREAKLRAEAGRKRSPVPTVALAAFAVVLVAGIALAGTNGQRGQRTVPEPRLKLASLSSLGKLRSPSAAGSPGPEGVLLPDAPDLAMTAAAPQPVHSIQCLGSEQLAFHVHAHLTLFDHAVAGRIPYGVGIEGPQTISKHLANRARRSLALPPARDRADESAAAKQGAAQEGLPLERCLRM
jgi:hypothetical protein